MTEIEGISPSWSFCMYLACMRHTYPVRQMMTIDRLASNRRNCKIATKILFYFIEELKKIYKINAKICGKINGAQILAFCQY